MKKIAYIILACTFLSTACKKQFDIVPLNFYTDDSFWKTADQASLALNGVYHVLTTSNMFGDYLGIRFETMSPNAHNYNNESNTRDIAEGVHTGTTLGIVGNRWKGNYQGIGRANNFIQKVAGVNMDAALKSRYLGEAKFLRAFYYSNLVDLYGGVPLIINAPDPAEQSALPRNTKDEVLAQVYKDLDEAAAALPTSYSSSDRGRVTKGAALALKARVLLYNGKFSEVITVCEQIILLNRYALFPNYRGLFLIPNKGNSEIIFDVQFKAPEITNNFDIALAQYSTIAPVQHLIDAYQMSDGKSIQNSPLYSAGKPYLNRDPRFYQTIIYLGARFRGKPADASVLHQTGYSFKKLTSYDTEDIGTINNTNSIAKPEMNFPLIRYADVLLMYAEALNEVNGPTQQVYNEVNKIRSRPTVGMPGLPAGLTKQQMQLAIRLERRIELAGEGLYFYDVRRWKTAETENAGKFRDYKGDVVSTRVFNPNRDYLWPIPFTDIQLNPSLKQNPIY